MSVYLLWSVCHRLGIRAPHMLLIISSIARRLYTVFLASSFPVSLLKTFSLTAAEEMAHWLHNVV